MTSSRPQEPGAVRPLGTDAPPDTAGTSRATITVVALAGLAIGFILAVSSSTSRPGDDPGAAFDSGPPPLSEEAELTGDTAAPPPPNLDDYIPGFAGTLHVVTRLGEEAPVVYSWAADQPTARSSELPNGLVTSTMDWNADHSQLAAEGPGLGNRVLYAGPPRQVVPVALEVTSFAWHGTEPALIAWTEPDGDSSRLVTARLSTTDVTVTPIGPVDGDLVAWGEWGFLVRASDAGTVLVSLSPTGVARNSARSSIQRVVNTDVEFFLAPNGDDQVFDPVAAAPVTAVEIPPEAFLVTLSPSSRELLWITQPARREALLNIRRLDRPGLVEEVPIPPAEMLDRGSTGRFVLLWSLLSRIEEDDSVIRPLVLVDRLTATSQIVPLGRADVISAAVQAP